MELDTDLGVVVTQNLSVRWIGKTDEERIVTEGESVAVMTNAAKLGTLKRGGLKSGGKGEVSNVNKNRAVKVELEAFLTSGFQTRKKVPRQLVA